MATVNKTSESIFQLGCRAIEFGRASEAVCIEMSRERCISKFCALRLKTVARIKEELVKDHGEIRLTKWPHTVLETDRSGSNPGSVSSELLDFEEVT